MKMKSANLKKRRRKVIVSRRLNSISNRSLSFGTIVNNKRRIIALVKNNKTLAVALQDARCELSTKQKLLENTAKHFNNIMQARVQMLEMHSVLKTLMKNFDDILLLLKVDNIRISDLTVPFKSYNAFKNKMKNLAKSVEKVPEENSFSDDQEKFSKDNNIIRTLNSDISGGHNSSNVNYVPTVTDESPENISTDFGTKGNLPVQVATENASAFNCWNTVNTVSSMSSVIFAENSIEAINPNEEKQTSPTKKDSLKDRESTGTPKLSIPSIMPCINSEVSSIFKNPSFLVENTSTVLKPSISSLQNLRSSKIPQFQALTARAKKESNLSDIVTGSKKISSKQNLDTSVEPCLKVRRKTFVVKNSEAAATISESTSTSNQWEIKNENNANVIEDSGEINRRETFVVKDFDSSEDTTKPLCNRRKTFVKKSNSSINTRKSMNNRRDTFVLPDTKKNYFNNENVASATEDLVCDDIIEKKLCQPPSVRKVGEELQSVCDKINENSKAFKDNLVCSKISSTSHTISLQGYSQGKETESKRRKITNKKKVKELKQEKYRSNDAEENSLKAENMIEEVVICDNVESSNVCVTIQDCVQILQDESKIEILEDNVRRSRSQKRVSYEMFLESSDSDCESIPDLDLQSITESSIKSFPVRRKISRSRKKKVFAFSSLKRKSVHSKKSLNILPKTVEHPDFIKESEDVPQFDSISIQNEDYISMNNSKYQSKEKQGKSVDCTAKISDSGKSFNAHHEAPTNELEMLQSTSAGDKNTEYSKSVDNENPQNQGCLKTELSVSKSDVNKNSLSCNDSPVITSDKCVNVIEFTSENLDCNSKDSKEGQDIINNISNKTEPEVKTNTSGKNNKVKKHTSKFCHMDDIPVKKNTKRNNSKKQSKQIITVDEGQEDEIELLVNKKGQGKKKKQNNKTKITMGKRKSPIKSLKDNTIIVRAEVHPPPPFLSKSETEVLNKENKGKPLCENFEVSVVLSDIFQSTNIDLLTLSHKDKLVRNNRNISLKTPLSDNSSNILTSVADSNKSDTSTASSVQEIKHNKRNRLANYAEPSLRKKLRR